MKANTVTAVVTMYWPPAMDSLNPVEVSTAPVSSTPSAPVMVHAPEVRITSPVIVHTASVSMNVPSIAMTPWRTGLLVCAAVWAIVAEPSPDSFQKTSRAIPMRMAAAVGRAIEVGVLIRLALRFTSSGNIVRAAERVRVACPRARHHAIRRE